jgi:hypothetical protein
MRTTRMTSVRATGDTTFDVAAAMDLTTFVATVSGHLRDHFPAGTLALRQVLCPVEESGEFVAAYRRWPGRPAYSSQGTSWYRAVVCSSMADRL